MKRNLGLALNSTAVRGVTAGVLSGAMSVTIGLFIFTGSAFLGGCSKGLSQDPLKGQPQGVLPAPQKPVDPHKAPDPNLLRIDNAGHFYDFIEGRGSQVVITGRSLVPDTHFKLSVQNLSDFPGATVTMVDEANPDAGLNFNWQPPAGFTHDAYSVNLQMNLQMDEIGGQLNTRRETVEIVVTRQTGVPQIVSVEDLTTVPTRESEKRSFTILVRDPDGINVDGMRPVLNVFSDQSYEGDVSPFVKNVSDYKKPSPVQSATDPTLWTFNMELDPANHNLTLNEETFTFAVKATSRLGISSASSHVSAKIRTAVRAPITSWTEPVTVLAGEDAVFRFFVMDPKGSGKVSVNWGDLPSVILGDASWDCPPARSASVATICTIHWHVPTNAAQAHYEVPMELRNQSPVSGDTQDAKVRVVGVFNVRKNLPQPSPTPAPKPTPAQPFKFAPTARY